MDISYSESESESKSNGHAKKNTMEKKSNIKSCKVISMLLLPKDLMMKIISRVSRNSARYVRKHWATVIGSSHFAEAQHTHSKPGLYVEDLNSKTNIKSCKVISMLLLPEDLMIDIFSRVSLKCLLNSARYVCKPWAAIIGSSHFAEAQHAHSKPGLYVEDLNSKTNSYFMDIKDDLNGHFERIDLGMPPEMGRLVGTCGGLLLFWCYDERIFVLNPILKCCLKVPSPPTPRQLAPNKFIIARVPRSAIFKLFFVDYVDVLGAQWYVFYVLKIGINNSWKEIARKKYTVGYESIYTGYMDLQLVYSGGNDLYWITTKEVMVMDVDKEIIVGEYPLPSPLLVDIYLSRNFLWMENQLSCIVHEGRSTETFQIYILDTDSRKWTLYDEMGPFDYMVVCPHGLHVVHTRFRFWMNGKLILQLYFYGNEKTVNIHYVYNVKTRRLTKIEGIPKDDFEVWLHTNRLASMPST